VLKAIGSLGPSSKHKLIYFFCNLSLLKLDVLCCKHAFFPTCDFLGSM